MSHQPHPSRTGANARGLIVAGCLGAMVLAHGCASVSIEDAVPTGALASSTGAAGPATPPAPATSLEALQPPAAPQEPALVAATTPQDSAAVAETEAPAEVDGIAAAAPRETGQFPNLNLPPRSATSQFTRAESSAKTSELRGAASQVEEAGAGISADKKELERLRKLGQSHGKDALKAIEKR